jgi:hypothetical protein
VKDVGSLGKWILHLATFKVNVHNTRGVNKVVTKSFSLMFKGHILLPMEQGFPLVYSLA